MQACKIIDVQRCSISHACHFSCWVRTHVRLFELLRNSANVHHRILNDKQFIYNLHDGANWGLAIGVVFGWICDIMCDFWLLHIYCQGKNRILELQIFDESLETVDWSVIDLLSKNMACKLVTITHTRKFSKEVSLHGKWKRFNLSLSGCERIPSYG